VLAELGRRRQLRAPTQQAAAARRRGEGPSGCRQRARGVGRGPRRRQRVRARYATRVERPGSTGLRGGDQRVRGSHTISVDDKDAASTASSITAGSPIAASWATVRSALRATRAPAADLRQPADAGTEHVFDRVGHGRSADPAGRPRQRPADLEREERVAEGRVDEAAHQTAREAEAEAVEQELARRAEAQRSHVEAFELRWSNGPLERRHSTGALREQEADRSRLESGGRKREHLTRRRVEPLHVVDRDQERLPHRHGTEEIQGGKHDRTRLRRPTARFGAEGDLERPTLGAGSSRSSSVSIWSNRSMSAANASRAGALLAPVEKPRSPAGLAERCRPPRAWSCRCPAHRPAPTPGSRPSLRGTRAAGQAPALARSASRGRL
jgi:hypothetical protein